MQSSKLVDSTIRCAQLALPFTAVQDLLEYNGLTAAEASTAVHIEMFLNNFSKVYFSAAHGAAVQGWVV